MARIRVLVVEDSLTIREYLMGIVRADPELELVGEADNGQRAIELCAALRPDVITLDMMLPVLTGLDATVQIMAHHPTPILVVSASINRGELFRTYDALAAGAVDVLDKPTGGEADGDWERRFRATVKLVSRIKVITHLRGRLSNLRRPETPAIVPSSRTGGFQVLAIGASTGGPAAVTEVLRALPVPFTVPILIVVHIGTPFGAAFAEWLNDQTPHRVSTAIDGAQLEAGRVLLAPAEKHLSLHGSSVRLTSDPERHSCRPSVDTLFEAVARVYGNTGAACLLTGMGRDGAAGMLEIRRAGGFTIAQDEQSSVVHGMPREAILLGAAERVLALAEIGPVLANLIVGQKRLSS